jgi:hypothetical protein
VSGIQFILGNDLAGERVHVHPIVVDKPQSLENDELQNEFPEVLQACIVTRSMAKMAESQKEAVVPEKDFEDGIKPQHDNQNELNQGIDVSESDYDKSAIVHV